MNQVSLDDTPENLVAYIAQPVYSIRAWLGLLAVLCFLASVSYTLLALPAAADTPTLVVTLWEGASGVVFALLLGIGAKDIRKAVDSGKPGDLLRFMVHIRWIILFLWLQLIAGLVLTAVLVIITSK
jgi:hypothetical protein